MPNVKKIRRNLNVTTVIADRPIEKLAKRGFKPGLSIAQLRRRGLMPRYNVQKSDGTPVDPRAEYFVLRVDEHGGDKTHIRGGRIALMAYAAYIEPFNPKLAADLRARYGSSRRLFGRNAVIKPG